MTVQFQRSFEDSALSHTAIVARSKNQWVFCQEQDKCMILSGRRDASESILGAAERILRKETGAAAFTLIPVCAYTVQKNDPSNIHGMLYYAVIDSLPEHKPASLVLEEQLPVSWTEPALQLPFLNQVQAAGLTRIAG